MALPPPAGWTGVQVPGPAPLDQPQYDATIRQAAERFWRKARVFSGRASRSEYWWWVLISLVISVALQVLGSVIFGGGLFLYASQSPWDPRTLWLPLVPSLIWSLIVLIPSIALAVRRLHDTNRTGWWYLLSLPALVASPFLLIGLASVDPVRIEAGDFSGIAVGSLAAGALLSLVGAVGSIVLLVFFILDPDPRGARFDRRG